MSFQRPEFDNARWHEHIVLVDGGFHRLEEVLVKQGLSDRVRTTHTLGGMILADMTDDTCFEIMDRIRAGIITEIRSVGPNRSIQA